MLSDLVVQKASCITNLDSCLDLITCEYPELDAGVLEGDDGLGDILLKAIFNGSGANKLHISLDLSAHIHDSLLTILKRIDCLLEPFIPGIVLSGAQIFLCEHQCAETLPGELINVVLGLGKELFLSAISSCQELFHDGVGTLGV